MFVTITTVLIQSCARGGRRIVEDMCYEIRRTEAASSWTSLSRASLLFITAVPIIKLFAWGRGIVEDMCYEVRRAEACVD